jgi:hypothetical protein
MSNIDKRKEIIESLSEYLPKISISINELVKYLQDLAKKSVKEPELISPIYKNLNKLIPNLEKIIKAADPKTIKAEENDPVLRLYKESLVNILVGISSMLKWLKSEDQPIDGLVHSIDLLFKAGQQVLDLVNLITNE